jgi:hypothetical protein
MRVKLELEDFEFVTASIETLGRYRWLLVKLGDKQFHVHRAIDEFRWQRQGFREEVDRTLIESMELMLESVLLKGTDTLPDGAIEVRCPTGQLWRYHYGGNCGCKPQGGGQ